MEDTLILSSFVRGVIYGFVIVLLQPNSVPINVRVVFCYHMNPVILICSFVHDLLFHKVVLMKEMCLEMLLLENDDTKLMFHLPRT
jgi:hypothetical protein